MNKKKIQIIVLLALILILAIYGIYQLASMSPTSEQKPPVSTKPAITIEKQPFVEEKIIKVYSYEVHNLRDPFYPQIIRKELVKGASALENYDIEELKLTGIIKDIKGFRALIKTPDNKHYVVKEKDKVGLNGGQITKISKDTVEIKEIVRSHTGEPLQTTKILKLRTEEGL